MATATTKTTKTRAKTPEKPCGCYAIPDAELPFTYESCGRLTGSEFAPGHDAKLKSALIECAVAGQPITQVINGKAHKADPRAIAAERGWVKFIDRAVEVATEKAERKAKQEAERQAARDEKAAAKEATRAKRAAAKAEASPSKVDEVAAKRAARKAPAAKASKPKGTARKAPGTKSVAANLPSR